MQNDIELMRIAYDRIVGDYDAHWAVHVSEPQARLTRALALRPGDRCADLGCGTGVETVAMLRLVSPGEVVAVDCSPNMLEAARDRARSAGGTLTAYCQGGDEFIERCEEASFDVFSLRFSLGYLNWPHALRRLPRLLRAGGRIGILTILASSAPQAYAVYRGMASDLGLPDVPLTAATSLEQIERELARSGARIDNSWIYDFRLRFQSGAEMAAWLQTSGITNTPSLTAVAPELQRVLWKDFATRVEAYREGATVPLDFSLAGVVAHVAA